MQSATILITAGFALAGIASGAYAAKKPMQPTGFVFRSINVAKHDYPYTVYVPRNYDPAKSWPVIMFLHGAGECGSDGWKPVMQGIGTAIMQDIDKWPFIVLIPQKPEIRNAWEQYDDMIMALLKNAQKDYNVDASRLYLTGLSQGGHGTWVLGAKHPDVWAAVAPICGYGGQRFPGDAQPTDLPPAFSGPASEIGKGLKTVPVWAFHGEADPVVPIKESQDLVAAVNEAGGSAKLTSYPGVEHNSWDRAYRTENLGAWFLTHTRPAK